MPLTPSKGTSGGRVEFRPKKAQPARNRVVEATTSTGVRTPKPISPPSDAVLPRGYQLPATHAESVKTTQSRPTSPPADIDSAWGSPALLPLSPVTGQSQPTVRASPLSRTLDVNEGRRASGSTDNTTANNAPPPTGTSGAAMSGPKPVSKPPLPTFPSSAAASTGEAPRKGPRPVLPPPKPSSPRRPSTAHAGALTASGRDDPTVTVPAKKYSFDTKESVWIEMDVVVRVPHPNRGLSQGGMRVCFEVDEVDESGCSSFMVAKMFRHNIEDVKRMDYFREAEAQCLCTDFAEVFNQKSCGGGAQQAASSATTKKGLSQSVRERELEADSDAKPVVSFLQCNVVHILDEHIPAEYLHKRTGFFSYRTRDTREMLFCMEPKMSGTFTKYTNNYGAVYETNETYISAASNQLRRRILDTVEAFSHFTLVASESTMLVCDLQGVHDCLTDPQIHTDDGIGLGMGNMGLAGIEQWVRGHQCNDTCRNMNLERAGPFLLRMKRERQQNPTQFQKLKKSNRFWMLVEGLRSAQVGNSVTIRKAPAFEPPPAPPEVPQRPTAAQPPPPSKPVEEMTEDERFDYAIMLSSFIST